MSRKPTGKVERTAQGADVVIMVASRTGEPMPDFAEYYPSQKEHYTIT